MAADVDPIRRALVGLTAIALASPGSPAWSASAPSRVRRALCSGRIRQSASGMRHELAALEILADQNLRALWVVDLPSRVHGIALAPVPGEVVICARRPGAWLMRVRVSDGAILARYDLDGDAWLQGHVSASADGNLIFAGEVDLEERSTIGLFDAKTLRRVGALQSGGVEPHELLVVDASTLLIAHGGRRNTLRDGDTLHLNAACESSLTWLDTSSGKVRHELRPGDVRISLRHLAALTDGKWVVGAQSDADDSLPTVAIADSGALTWLARSDSFGGNYVASVGAGRRCISAAAPRSGYVIRWGTEGEFQAAQSIVRASGVASTDNRVWISTEEGALLAVDNQMITDQRAPSTDKIIWDNHMQLVGF